LASNFIVGNSCLLKNKGLPVAQLDRASAF